MTISTLTVRAWLAAGLMACASCGPGPAKDRPAAPRAALGDAFAVAFGKPAPYATLDDSGDRVIYSPQALIDVSPGVVALISKEETPGGCKGCAGALAINYLKRGPAGFSRMGSWRRVGGMGRWGGVLPWTIRTDLDNGPTLVTRNDDREPGCSATTEELITLGPRGPVKIATVVVATAYDPEPGSRMAGPHVSGEITPLIRGQRFVVALSGTETARQVFNRQGDVFTTYNPGATGC